MSNGLSLYQKFLDYMFETGSISIPEDFHGRCAKVKEMTDNDITGTINTIVNYAINSASETVYAVESDNETVEKILNLWLSQINLMVNGIPTGIHELTKEYLKERWSGSSLCLLRVSAWKNITVGNVTISVPTVLWFVNGASVYVDRNDKNYKLGEDKYYLDKELKKPVPSKASENIVVNKPFGRWFDKYPVPYLVKNGVLKNFLGIRAVQEKSDEVITKVLPYLFVITKGTEKLFLDGKVDYKDSDLATLVDNFKTALETYKSEKDHTPTNAVPFDQKYDHLIPDLSKILSEELYRQGYRALLSGLGFVDVIQGVSSTRKESVLNPKPFISEVNAGVDGFKTVLLEIINLIIANNKDSHKKIFSDNVDLKITNSPLKINVEEIIDQLRSGFVYGVVSIRTYQEVLGVDPDKELQRLKKEWENGMRDTCYPHMIQNQEDKGIDTVPLTKKQIEKQGEKQKKPEDMQEAEVINEPIDSNLEIAPYDKDNPPDFLKKYPKGAINIFIEVFNKEYPKGEDYAFPVAWTALKRWMKKNGYKKVGDKWVKSEIEND